MTVLMTKKKADAIRSIERDQHLLSDKAVQQRYDDATGERPLSERERVALDKMRQKLGK